MKTAEKNANSVQGTAEKANETTNRTANRPSLTGKEAKQDGSTTDENQPKLRKMRKLRLPRLRPIAPLQWITNPLTLQTYLPPKK